MRPLAILSLAGLAACAGDETLSGYGAGDRTWLLQELDGRPVTERVTLRFPEEGQLGGTAPCNLYSGQQTVPYPWFKAENIVATRRACPALDLETRYFEALTRMTLSEVLGDTLILRDEAGAELVFTAE